MTDKRFEVDIDHLLTVWDTEKNKRLEIEQIVDKLNEFSEKNKVLSKKLRVLSNELEKIKEEFNKIPERIKEVWIE